MVERYPRDAVLPGDWEHFRVELTGYCYRMLGSPFDAEDAVQETFLRAWRSRSSFDPSRASLRTWLYSIATNVCLDTLKTASRRRELAVDMGPPSSPGPDLGTPLPEASWVLPIADARAIPRTSDPAERAILRESIRLAFVAALQQLPPRQRAALILRDVLCCTSAEAAGILETTTASVNSALQRARTTLANTAPVPAPLDPESDVLLRHYCEAFENDDIDALIALLHEDGTTSMPPFPWWLRGRHAIEAALRAAGSPCAGSRLVPVLANGTTAVARYSPDDDGCLRPFGLTVIEWLDGRMIAATTFLEQPSRLFQMFGLADELPDAALPERRGHGHTADVDGPITIENMAADMVAFIEQLVGGPAALVGYSAGASVALWAATHRPDLVPALVMISGASDPAGLIVRPDPDAEWPPQVIAAYGEVSPDGEAHFPVIARKIAESVDEGSPLTAADLGRVTCPALVVAADDDIVTLEHTIGLYRALPDGHLAIVPGSSHLLLHEHPGLCTQLIGAFLAGQRGPRLMPVSRSGEPTDWQDESRASS